MIENSKENIIKNRTRIKEYNKQLKEKEKNLFNIINSFVYVSAEEKEILENFIKNMKSINGFRTVARDDIRAACEDFLYLKRLLPGKAFQKTGRTVNNIYVYNLKVVSFLVYLLKKSEFGETCCFDFKIIWNKKNVNNDTYKKESLLSIVNETKFDYIEGRIIKKGKKHE